ncbi:cohesin domain-containing protein [Accumulibacter sp.]|uniref:cohesin domain-containing protein n=1 Tax=Accumulibacter sp. TaxID=2053492 RepID=UPI0025E69308|nr:cohesin domain-containing protein [Accumulibacter sp.]MCM8594072.1 cohesin domain-containing protein [Accumulibacter sp.]MCM8624480.1 cohesin domain-containing protein [Accumulibacter sp.]MDS4048216.1 cohesin domain-containing protein [Accumulibacter sp.]
MNLAGNACALSLCALLLGYIPAGAEAALSIDAPASAAQGTRAMTVSLFESDTQGLIAADLLFRFDPAAFSYVGTTLGTATGGFSLVANKTAAGEVAISLASGDGSPVPSGTLVDVELDIGDNAGVFGLSFEAILDEQGAEVVTHSLTVVPAGEIPEPRGSWLFAAAALALLASRCHALASERCRAGA